MWTVVKWFISLQLLTTEEPGRISPLELFQKVSSSSISTSTWEFKKKKALYDSDVGFN